MHQQTQQQAYNSCLWKHKGRSALWMWVRAFASLVYSLPPQTVSRVVLRLLPHWSSLKRRKQSSIVSSSLPGATVRVRPDEVFNISMRLHDGNIREGGIWGLRVDFWDDVTDTYPPASSLFFYDVSAEMKVGMASFFT